MTNLTEQETKVLDCVFDEASAKDPILSRDICRITMLSGRTLRATIASLNEKGHPVICTGKGFYLSEDGKDTKIASKILRAKAYSLLRRAGHLDNTSPTQQATQMNIEFNQAQ